MPCDCLDFAFLDFTFKDILLTIGLAITIIGWLVSNNAANNREKRKETRSEIDACIKQLGELILKVRDYFTKPSDDQQVKLVSASIRFELQRLIERLEVLENKYSQFEVVTACGELFDSITGDPFDSTGRVEMLPSSDRMLKIESDIHCLVRQLETGFRKKFP